MAEAAIDERWNHTATICALIANCHRDHRRRAFASADFHPRVRETPPAPLPIADISILKTVFVDRRLPEVP